MGTSGVYPFPLLIVPRSSLPSTVTPFSAHRPVLVFHFASAVCDVDRGKWMCLFDFDWTLLSLHSLYELYAILYTYSVWMFYTKVIVNEYNNGSTRFPFFFLIKWQLNYTQMQLFNCVTYKETPLFCILLCTDFKYVYI